jgi:psiF repeat-containing protein
MKHGSLYVIALAFSLAASPVLAESDKAPSQQTRFASCAHESKGLKGDEHHQFMSECLKGHGASEGTHKKEASHKASADGSQQNRMKSCNEAAGRKNLHGDERRAFMSSCLKG